MTYSVSKRATTKYYLIPIQSFSDIITNSSSETYIVDTSYTAKALEEVLEGIHKKYEGEEFYSGECCGMIMELHLNLRKTMWLGFSKYL